MQCTTYGVKIHSFSDFFSCHRYNNGTIYTLDSSKLSEKECYFFFPLDGKEHLIATALEFMTFHPNTPLNDKFNINPVVDRGLGLFVCRFPIEFKNVCERVAKIFKMTMLVKPFSFLHIAPEKHEMVAEIFPRHENVFFFEGACAVNMLEERARLIALGNSLDRLSID